MAIQSLDVQISSAARQLWMRGMLVGCNGLISAEHHRRRYLATPPGLRHSDVDPADLMSVDIGGASIETSQSIDADTWQPHRMAYQSSLGNDGDGSVGATILACPPMLLTLVRSHGPGTSLDLPGHSTIPIIEDNEDTLKQAVATYRLVVIADRGVLVTGPDLPFVLNLLESAEHAATIELACHRS